MDATCSLQAISSEVGHTCKKKKSKSFVTNELCEIYRFEIKVKYCSLTCPKLKEEVLIFISHSQSHLSLDIHEN